MVVYKFGGATTRTARGLETLVGLVRDAHVAQISAARRRKKRTDLTHGVVVVVSAIGHTTRQLQRSAELARDGALAQALENLDRLLLQHDQLASTLRLLPPSLKRFAEEITRIAKATVALIEGISITRELTNRVRDSVLAQGEALAMALISVLLEERGLPMKVIDARGVVITTEDFGSATPIMEEIEQQAKATILPWLERSTIVLMQGFVGATRDGRTTTMGSESSDLTGTILARALSAEEVTIWKSVPGIFTADPELVPQAKLIKSLSFAEAEEIGRRGARVLHPEVAHPLKNAKKEILLKVASPKATKNKLTSIGAEQVAGRCRALAVAVEQNLASVSVKRSYNINLSTVEQRKSRQAFQKVLHTISSTERSIVFLRKEDRAEFLALTKSRAMDTRSTDPKEKKPLASVSLIIRNTTDSGDLREQFFKSLRQYAPLAIFPIENSLVAILDQELSVAALRKLHKDFFGT